MTKSPLLNFPEMSPSSTFYQTVTLETMTATKILTSFFAVYFQVLLMYKVSLPSSGRKKLVNNQNFRFFVSDHLKRCNLITPQLKVHQLL